MKKLFLSLLAGLLVSVMLCTGATFAAEELPETTVEVFNDLAITFTLEKTRVVGDGNYAVVTHTYADGRPDTQETISQTAWVEEDTAYKFTYGGYAAKEMTDALSVVVYDADAKPVAQWTTSAYEIMTAHMTTTFSESKRALLEATLNYGAAAQRYFDYASDNLANKELNAEDSYLTAIHSQLSSSRRDVSYLTGSNAAVVYGTSCVLGNKLQMRVYFTDNSKQVFVNGTEVQLQESKTEGYYYYAKDVAAKEIFDSVNIVVKENDIVVAAARDSVASYCARLYKQADKKDIALADAILTYGLAARGLKQEVAEPTVVGTYAYTGVEQTLELDGFDGSYMTVSGNKQTNAGEYEAVVTLNSGYQWANGADGKIAWSIGRQELAATNAVISDKDANGVLDDAVVESIVFTGLQNGESLMEGEDYTVTAAYGTVEAGEDVPVTVTVTLLETDKTKNYTLPNGTFQTTGKVTEPVTDKFSLVFENTEKYLYRVGNKNVVELGSLFAASDDAKLGDVTVTVTKQEGTASGTYTANSDWTKGTIKFSGTGVVKVTIAGTYANPLSLYLEVVDGYNVTTYSGGSYPLGNRNSVLLNDIAITENAQYKFSNATLYGNGFTFDVTAGKDGDEEKGNAFGNGTVILNSAKLDNIRIVGEVFLEYGQLVSDLYNFATVLVMGSTVIENSYISNGGSAVRTVNCTSLDLINTTLEGGIFANLDIRSGKITLDNVVTINQSDASGKSTSTDRKTEAEQSVVGLGIVMYDATTAEIIINKLVQHNNISNKVEPTGQDAETLVDSVLFGDVDLSKYVYTDENNVKWVNTGIISMTDGVGREKITVNDPKIESTYDSANVKVVGVNGCLYSTTSYTETKEEYVTVGQAAILPTCTFDYTTKNYQAKTDGSNAYCYYNKDTDTVQVSFDEGSSKVYDPNILTVTKHNEKLDVAVSIGGVDYTGKTITFRETGEYEILYTYTDPFHFVTDADKGYAAQPKAYSKTRTVSVAAVAPTAKPAKFTFYGFIEEGTKPEVEIKETKTVTANGKTFVMPVMPAEAGDFVETKTVDGVQVNCPVVHVDEYYNGDFAKDYNMLFPFFTGVTIEDYANGGTAKETTVVADHTTTTEPDGFTVITPHTPKPGWSSNVVSSGKAGTYGKISKGTYEGLYGATSGAISAAEGDQPTHKADELVGKFSYKDNMGNTFYYCILFKIPERKASDNTSENPCVTPDTMITLADGTQKRVDALDGTEQLLVWNLQTGALDSAPIMFVDKDAEDTREIVRLRFSDGSEVDVIYEHGFWDYDLNRYVYLDANAADYIGHSFAKQDGESLQKVQLTDVVIETRVTTAWSPVTEEHLCYFVNSMLSMPGGIDGLFNFFEVDPATMTYDYEAMERDIKTYGLFTYEELNAIAPLSEEMFNAAGGAYLKVSIGKGNLTVDELIYMIERYSTFFDG